MFVIAIALKYALLVSQLSCGHFLKLGLIRFYSNNTINFRNLTQTHYIMLYPQNGDRIVTIDSVTSPPYVYRCAGLTVSERKRILIQFKKVKFSHTRYRALGPELIPVYRQ